MTRKVLLLVTVICVALVVWFYSTPLQVAHSQGETEVQCGQMLERNFTNDKQKHIYVLPIDPRWSFDVSVEPFGDDLKTVIILYGPTGLVVDATNVDNFAFTIPQESPSIGSGTISARGKYSILVANAPVSVSSGEVLNSSRYFGGVGFYTLSIGCTTSDGQKIEPSPLPQPTPTTALIANSEPSFVSVPLPFLESGKSYDVYLNSDILSITVVEIREDGWIRVAIDNRVGWLNLSQVALIIPHDE